jgi:hypothetical protein
MNPASRDWISRGRRNNAVSKEVPGPEQIRKACLEIQQEWTEKERRRRGGLIKLVRILQCPAPAGTIRDDQ